MDPFPPEALLAPYPPGHKDVANALRRLVKRAVPDAIERVRPGWGLIGYDVPVGRRTRYFAFIWPEPDTSTSASSTASSWTIRKECCSERASPRRSAG
jgi:hypothetical protein